MAGSGLRRSLELVYAANMVTHMFSGKAYARAFRGHLLVDAALNTMLASKLFGTLVPVTSQSPENRDGEDDPVNESEGETADLEQMDDVDTSESGQTADRLQLDDSTTGPVDIDTSTVDLHELQIQYDALLQGDVDVENAISTDVFNTIDSRLKDERDTMKDL
jgi:hypothetical protein